ncbi:MAG: Holliday junction resolvase RuvX, partial [bacterium]|nr:Holliday junction resolvase RuvX [bacterium]
GIDFGVKRIGLALSDPQGKIARPRGVLERRSPQADVRRICLLAVEAGVDEVVLGLPLKEDGTRGKAAAAVEAFLAGLESHLDLPIHLLDERYTTKAAEGALREAGLDERAARKNVDAVAAALILQAHLDRRSLADAGE